jgi:hypothetical protein
MLMKRSLPLYDFVILITAIIFTTGVASGQTPLTEISKDVKTVNSDSITVSFAQKIKLYPVPAISDLYIDNIVNVTRIEIFDVSQLPRGIYFIRFFTPGSTAIKRFTKE